MQPSSGIDFLFGNFWQACKENLFLFWFITYPSGNVASSSSIFLPFSFLKFQLHPKKWKKFIKMTKDNFPPWGRRKEINYLFSLFCKDFRTRNLTFTTLNRVFVPFFSTLSELWKYPYSCVCVYVKNKQKPKCNTNPPPTPPKKTPPEQKPPKQKGRRGEVV